MSKEAKNTLKTILTYAVLILMALVMLVPCMDDFCFPETGEGRILLSDRMDSKGSGME